MRESRKNSSGKASSKKQERPKSTMAMDSNGKDFSKKLASRLVELQDKQDATGNNDGFQNIPLHEQSEIVHHGELIVSKETLSRSRYDDDNVVNMASIETFQKRM